MKKFKILLGVMLGMLAVTLGVSVFCFVSCRDSRGFVKGTRLDNKNVTGMIPEEIIDDVDSEYKGFKIRITENGKTAMEGIAEDYGYIYDRMDAVRELEQILAEQKRNYLTYYKTLFLGSELVLRQAYKFDSNVFKDRVSSDNLAEPRVPSSDASFCLNEDGSEYIIADATKGNEIDDRLLREFVQKAIKTAINDGNVATELVIEIPAEAYISVMGSNDKTELIKELPAKNKELRLQNKYKDVNIIYTFGKEEEVLSGNQILEWVGYSGSSDRIVVDQTKIKEYVDELAEIYDTLWLSRKFVTTAGKTVSVDSAHNAYGYRISRENEYKQLKKDILEAKSVKREPIYDGEGAYGNPLYLSRNGTDDLNGTYVEVSIGSQHVWFYKNGKLVVDDDCVTGKISNGHGTIPGAYPLAYKQKSRVLRGGTGAGAYSTFVNYWMPFNLGQGLHDASWRAKFGGNIYYNRGSHGCVNLPLKTAKKIFENIDAGTAIIVYN